MFNNLFLLRLQEASRKTPEKHQVPSQNFELFSPQISRLIPTNHNQHRLSKSMASSLLNAVKLSLFSPLHLPSSSPSRPSPVSFPRNGSSSFRVAALAQKWESSKVVPQADRVLVRLESLPEKSAGGVLLPKSAVKFERYLMGEVLSVGADVGEVEAGKKVLFSDINAYEVDLGTDAKHCFCRASELLAVVE